MLKLKSKYWVTKHDLLMQAKCIKLTTNGFIGINAFHVIDTYDYNDVVLAKTKLFTFSDIFGKKLKKLKLIECARDPCAHFIFYLMKLPINNEICHDDCFYNLKSSYHKMILDPLNIDLLANFLLDIIDLYKHINDYYNMSYELNISYTFTDVHEIVTDKNAAYMSMAIKNSLYNERCSADVRLNSLSYLFRRYTNSIGLTYYGLLIKMCELYGLIPVYE